MTDIVDNDSNEPMIPLFDYGSINQDHIAAATEIAGLAEQFGSSMLAELIRSRFKVKEIPKYDMTNSKFINECTKANIHCNVQGFVQEGQEPDYMQYQLVSICEDIRKLDAFIDSIKST